MQLSACPGVLCSILWQWPHQSCVGLKSRSKHQSPRDVQGDERLRETVWAGPRPQHAHHREWRPGVRDGARAGWLLARRGNGDLTGDAFACLGTAHLRRRDDLKTIKIKTRNPGECTGGQAFKIDQNRLRDGWG